MVAKCNTLRYNVEKKNFREEWPMKRNSLFTLIAVILALSLCLCACGKKEKVLDDGPMALTGWTLTPKTWSSPNGATVCLSAEVNHVDETVAAEFVVRQGDADVCNAQCTWKDGKLIAEAELNAADGYSYFVVLTPLDGATPTEVALNTTESPVSTSLTNLASALNSYCNVIVEDSEIAGSTLTITAGSVEIQVPQITDDGKDITCQEVSLVLTMDGEELTRVSVDPQASEVPGGFEADLSGTSFTIPAMEQEGQIVMMLHVKLSNGQELTTEGASWTYMDGQMVSTVG